MNKMDSSARLRRNTNTTFQVVANEAILIHLNTGTYFSLNKVGTEFWQMLDGEQTIQAHAATLAVKYNVEAAMVAADLLELAEKMAADNLLDQV